MSAEFIWPIRVYYEDTDVGGVVYHANYLKFFERARTEWLRNLGIDQAALITKDLVFAVKSVNTEFVLPAKFNDHLEVVSRLSGLSGASLVFQQSLYYQNDRSVCLCQGEVKVVCLTLSTFKPCRIPTEIKEEFQRVS
ncbi:tol-pal system-associated acyl-CoA thioesterase [Aliikangiella sp. IMCC44653]